MPSAADLAFVILYLVGGLALIDLAARARRRQVAQAEVEAAARLRTNDQSGEALGYLVAGHIGALAAAVARLRVADAVTFDPSTKKLVAKRRATGEPEHDGTALAAMVLDAAAEKPDGIDLSAVKDHPEVKAALDNYKRVFGGWERPETSPRQFKPNGVPLLALGVVGLAWALIPPFRWYTDVPLGVMAVYAVLSGFSFSGEVYELSPPAVRALTTARLAHPHLEPSERPALRTYGPAAAAVAVGLHGMWVMRFTDESLAGGQFHEVPDDDDFTAGCGPG